MPIASAARSKLPAEMSPRSGAISTSRGPIPASCWSTVCLPRKLSSWRLTLNADVICSRLSGGVEMLTAITTVAQSLRASSIGRLLAMPPSTSKRPPISTGAIAPGTDMLARIAWATLPRSRTTDSPVSMSVASARNGTGSFRKSSIPTAVCVRFRKYASIETPATSPFGSTSPPSFTPYSGANSVL